MAIWQAPPPWRTLGPFIGLMVAALTAAGCARDLNKDLDLEPVPVEIRLTMRTEEPFDESTWYYMVFNFGSSPSTQAALAPIDRISNEDRGRNWEMYVAYHRDADAGDQFFTLQRPRPPMVIHVQDGPADALGGSFNPSTDAFNDIVVACQHGNSVQLITGREIVVRDNLYFDAPVTINEGPSPIRVFPTLVDADANTDVLVIYAGDGSGDAEIRPLQSVGDGTFTPQTATPISGIPVDAIQADFNPPVSGTGIPDLAILTVDSPGDSGTLRIFIGSGGGIYTAGAAIPIGIDPAQIAVGDLDAANLDIVVANRGASGGDGSISVLLGNGDGTFASPTELTVNGAATGVGIGEYFGSSGDIAYTYTEDDGTGHAAVYLKEETTQFATKPIVANLLNPAVSMLATETSGDSKSDIVIVNGIPGSGRANLFILRGDSKSVQGQQGQQDFLWNDFLVTYASGTEPSRIVPFDLNGDSRDDLIVPCSGTGENGNAIAIYFKLGKDNFTNEDVFWTDFDPQLLSSQRWFVQDGSGVFGSEWRLVIDPNEFWDLTLEPPDNFNVTFMTGTTGIAINQNTEQLGEIREATATPVSVPLTPGFLTDEQSLRLAAFDPGAGSQDIVFWSAVVN